MSAWLLNNLRNLMLAIDTMIYWLGTIAYRIFYYVSDFMIFDVDGGMNDIISRIYIILSLAMFFVLAYNIILMISNPDKMTDTSDKSAVGLIKNTVISIALLVLLPTIFTYMGEIQHDIIQNNVIGNLILGGAGSYSQDRKYAGTTVMTTVFSSFYHPVVGANNDIALSPMDCSNYQDENSEGYEVCEKYLNAIGNAYNNNSISLFIKDSDLKTELKKGNMEYIFLISTIAGGIATYLFISFALDVGVRVVKLGALQILAPIPIIMRITKPHGGIFDKWYKEVLNTYLAVFIRLAVVFFAIFTIDLVTTNIDWGVKQYSASTSTVDNVVMASNNDNDNGELMLLSNDNNNYQVQLLATEGSVPSASDESGLIRMIANVIVILGALQFAKDAPKLIENLFGTNGTLKWRIKDKLNDNEYAKRLATVGTTLGANGYKNVMDLIAGRDPYGTRDADGNIIKKPRWQIFGSQLANAPASIVRGAKSGWQNGEKVDFSKGVKEGFRTMHKQAWDGVTDIQDMMDDHKRAREYTNAGMFNLKDADGNNHSYYIPGIGYAIGKVKKTFSDYKYQNLGREGEDLPTRIANNLNRRTGSKAKKAFKDMSSSVEEGLSYFQDGVTEATRELEIQKMRGEREYLNSVDEVQRKKAEYKVSYDAVFGINYDEEQIAAAQTRYEELYRIKADLDTIKSDYDSQRERIIGDSSLTPEEIKQKLDLIDQERKRKYNELNTSLEAVEEFNHMYEQLDGKYMGHYDQQEKALDASWTKRQKSLDTDIKRAKNAKIAENILDNQEQREAFIRENMPDIINNSETVSPEVLKQLIRETFGDKGVKFNEKTLEKLTMKDIYASWHAGKFQYYDDSGTLQTQELNADFVDSLTRLGKHLKAAGSGKTVGDGD